MLIVQCYIVIVVRQFRQQVNEHPGAFKNLVTPCSTGFGLLASETTNLTLMSATKTRIINSRDLDGVRI